LVQRQQQIVLSVFGAAAGQSQQGGEARVGIGFGQRAVFPQPEILPFDGDASGVADERIVAGQMRPGESDGARSFLP